MDNESILIILFLQFVTRIVYTHKFISVSLLTVILIKINFLNKINERKQFTSFKLSEKKLKINSLLIIIGFAICLMSQSLIFIFILILFDLLVLASLVFLKRKIDTWAKS